MSDLISRSELIKEIEYRLKCVREAQTMEVLANDGYMNYEQAENKGEIKCFITMIDTIKKQPTVYNIDKIIEELELHSFEFGTDSIPAHYVRLNDAIEIVKRGGIIDN